MEILIVGGTGVISYAVVQEAIKQNIKVTCINRGKSKTQVLNQNIEIITADYKNAQLIKSKLGDRVFDAVIDVLCYTKQDIEYSVNLFKDYCKQYIFFSSCAVYNNEVSICSENSPLINPLWDYSVKKVECENELIRLAQIHNLTYTIVRPAVTYGNTRIPYGITPAYGYHGTIIQRILNKKPIIVWEEGEAYCTITRVEDFAVGLIGLLGNPKAYNEAFNIVGDESYKWIEVLNILGEVLGVKPIVCNVSKEEFAREMPQISGEIIGGRAVSQISENKKLKECVEGFGTTITLKEGIKMTVDYYANNDYLLGIDFEFDAQWDRICKKYSSENRENLKFIDYLGSATKQEKKEYKIGTSKLHISIDTNLKRAQRLAKRIVGKFIKLE